MEKKSPLRVVSVAVLAIGVVSLSASPAAAQDLVWGSAYKNPWSSWDAYSYKRVEGKVRDKTRAALGKSSASDSGQTKVKRKPLSATDFKRNKKIGRAALDEYLASTGLPADQADQLRAALEATLAELEKEVRKNNVAASMAALIAVCTYVVNGVELDDATEDKLTAELNDVLAADPGFRKLKAKDRQKLSDTMLVQSALIIAFATWGQNDPGAKQAADQAARASLLFLTGSESGAVN